MMVRQDTIDLEASQHLIVSIFKILFENLERYVRMKKMCDADKQVMHLRCRFAEKVSEGSEDFDQYPMDIATYINKNGGERVVQGRVKIQRHMNDLKI